MMAIDQVTIITQTALEEVYGTGICPVPEEESIKEASVPGDSSGS
jgi:hypothetical protein